MGKGKKPANSAQRKGKEKCAPTKEIKLKLENEPGIVPVSVKLNITEEAERKRNVSGQVLLFYSALCSPAAALSFWWTEKHENSYNRSGSPVVRVSAQRHKSRRTEGMKRNIKWIFESPESTVYLKAFLFTLSARWKLMERASRINDGKTR